MFVLSVVSLGATRSGAQVGGKIKVTPYGVTESVL